jgi:hypothetical protein
MVAAENGVVVMRMSSLVGGADPAAAVIIERFPRI